MLKDTDEEDLPDKWYCHMNENDMVNNRCDASEKDTKWYHKHFQLARINVCDVETGVEGVQEKYTIVKDSPAKAAMPKTNVESEEKKQELVAKDEILVKMLDDKSSQAASFISKYYFHEALLEECDATTPDQEDAKPAASEKAGKTKKIEATVNSKRKDDNVKGPPSVEVSANGNSKTKKSQTTSNEKVKEESSGTPRKKPRAESTASAGSASRPSRRSQKEETPPGSAAQQKTAKSPAKGKSIESATLLGEDKIVRSSPRLEQTFLTSTPLKNGSIPRMSSSFTSTSKGSARRRRSDKISFSDSDDSSSYESRRSRNNKKKARASSVVKGKGDGNSVVVAARKRSLPDSHDSRGQNKRKSLAPRDEDESSVGSALSGHTPRPQVDPPQSLRKRIGRMSSKPSPRKPPVGEKNTSKPRFRPNPPPDSRRASEAKASPSERANSEQPSSNHRSSTSRRGSKSSEKPKPSHPDKVEVIDLLSDDEE
jgi:hypothetical protein